MAWKNTLEQALREAFQEGNERSLLGAIQCLSPEKKESYRKLWIELKEERAKKKNVEPLQAQDASEISE